VVVSASKRPLCEIQRIELGSHDEVIAMEASILCVHKVTVTRPHSVRIAG